MTFGRRGRSTPLKREVDPDLEAIRDDCVAIFINSGMTYVDIHNNGGPTPGTMSRWLYGETFFPRFDTISRLLRACGYTLNALTDKKSETLHEKPIHRRLELDTPFVGKPTMPPKRTVARQSHRQIRASSMRQAARGTKK